MSKFWIGAVSGPFIYVLRVNSWEREREGVHMLWIDDFVFCVCGYVQKYGNAMPARDSISVTERWTISNLKETLCIGPNECMYLCELRIIWLKRHYG